MATLAFLSGLMIGVLVDILRNNYYKQQFMKSSACIHAMKETVELLTSKVERLKGGRDNELDQSIDRGIMRGIAFVLSEKLQKY